MRLMTAAKNRALPVHRLNSADSIFTLFNAISRADQFALLTSAHAKAFSAKDGMTARTEAGFRGDSRPMWKFSARKVGQLPGVSAAGAQRRQDLMEQRVLTGHNRASLPLIEKAAQDGPVNAAFGAPHLAGTGGVPNLLAKGGWAPGTPADRAVIQRLTTAAASPKVCEQSMNGLP